MKYYYNTLTLDLANGLTDLQFAYNGEKIYYHHGTQTIRIKLDSTSSPEIRLRPKNTIEAEFDRFFISADERNETIELFIAKPKSINLGGGEIRVVTDLGYMDTLFKKAYITSQYCPLDGANPPCFEMHNPSNSDTYIMIEKVTFNSGGASQVHLYKNSVSRVGNIASVSNKYLETVLEVSVLESNYGNAPLGGTLITRFPSYANSVQHYQFERYLVMEPGVFLDFYVDSLLVNFWIQVEFMEYPYNPFT